VRQINGLGDVGTGLHAHGNYFNSSRAIYDGAVGVTQCPIPVGGQLTYEIPFSQGPGTYWCPASHFPAELELKPSRIHGHFNGQVCPSLV
jgi:iron transport multicopper oxidase